MFHKIKTCLILLFLGNAISVPSDEFRSHIDEGELTFNDERFLKSIMPSGYSPQKIRSTLRADLSQFINKDSENFKLFSKFMDKRVTAKGLIFNIYDDNMREATIALFGLLGELVVDEYNYKSAIKWLFQNVNEDMLMYVLRLMSLYYGNNFFSNENHPPFISKPNYFINSETIEKAFRLKVNDGYFDGQEAQVNQFYKTDGIIAINTNYSGWNLHCNGEEEEINYFREDVGLNSYYFGIHLMHPFWMNNDQLKILNMRHDEYYHFTHRQLAARYYLEKEHLKNKNTSTLKCNNQYNSYLIHDNGLPFPIRYSIKGEWNEHKAQIKSIDIGIRECISRGLIVMNNGSYISITEDNYVALLTKMIRANFEGVRTAKVVRAVYGANEYPANQYNPAPSLLHHPETTLRDPIYWTLLQYTLNYFILYEDSLKPFDLNTYQTNDFNITHNHFTKITTYFEYYQFSLNKLFKENKSNCVHSPLTISARQRRLKHVAFTLNFTVESKVNKDVIVRLFLGPQCYHNECWQLYAKFFQLDSFLTNLKKGANTLSWSPGLSDNFCFDDNFNLETSTRSGRKYNMFKFPENLLIPRGLEEGLNFTLFIIITSTNGSTEFDSQNSLNNHLRYEMDDQPLGFPFHRQSVFSGDLFSNFRFYNITIFHLTQLVDKSCYFSPHLY